MDPINYSVDVQSPFQAIAQGYQFGQLVKKDNQASEARDLALQQQKLAFARKQKQQEYLEQLSNKPDPTAQDYAKVTLLFPEMKDQADNAWKLLNADQQQSRLSDFAQVYGALSQGKNDVAQKYLEDKAASMEAAGVNPNQIKMYRDQSKLIGLHPELARTMTGLTLASLPKGEDVLKASAGLARDPLDLSIKNSEARIKAAEAGVAPESATLKNDKTRADIASTQNDDRIKQLNVQIAQANSETDRGRLVLERDKLVAEQGKKAIAESEGAQSQADSIDSSIQTIKAIRAHPSFQGAGSFTGKMAGHIPGTDRKEFEGLITTLKSQNFLTGVKQMQGMGALSNSEGDKIGSAVASLDPDMSPKALENALGVVESNLNRARSKLDASGKLPTNGGAFVAKSTQFGNVTEGQINQVLKDHPGSTREQVIRYLQTVK